MAVQGVGDVAFVPQHDGGRAANECRIVVSEADERRQFAHEALHVGARMIALRIRHWLSPAYNGYTLPANYAGTGTIWPVAALWCTAAVNSMYVTPVAKSVSTISSCPRMAPMNSLLHAPVALLFRIDVDLLQARVVSPAAEQPVAHLVVVQGAVAAEEPGTRLRGQAAYRTELKGGLPAARQVGNDVDVIRDVDLQGGVAFRVVALRHEDLGTRKNVAAGPTQRMTASYQMPMLRMLRPLRSCRCRQVSGASGLTKPGTVPRTVMA